MGRSIYTRRSIDKWITKVDDPLRSRLMQFRSGMEADGFRPSTVRAWLSQAWLFLKYLARLGKEPEATQPSDIAAFIQVRLRFCRQRRGHKPAHFVEWRCGYTGAIHRLLSEIQGQWPPTTASTLQIEMFKSHLLSRSFDALYVRDLCFHARQFLDYIDRCGFSLETVRDADLLTWLDSL